MDGEQRAKFYFSLMNLIILILRLQIQDVGIKHFIVKIANKGNYLEWSEHIQMIY